jgi:pyruvate kinase
MGKPSVTYGGFLNSMERNAMPASSDVNDVVNAVLDGTDCIYLSVTKRSEHQVHCVEFASSLCRQGEAAIWKQQLFSELNNKVSTRTHAVAAKRPVVAPPLGDSFGAKTGLDEFNPHISIGAIIFFNQYLVQTQRKSPFYIT